jgi:phytoene dehydrogenase-like protein
VAAQRQFDAIVIGSGIGGMAFAAIMARLRRWRVLVLERLSRLREVRRKR